MEGEQLFLPAIITRFDDEERRKLYTRVLKHVVNGKFTGRKVNGRPAVRLPTRSKTTRDTRVTIYASHVMLVMHGKLPREDEQASHLCHNRACIDVTHLVWESPGNNARRKHCVQHGKCVCKLQPPCLMKCLP